ncbi:MAG: hypothetical protein RL335_1071 [Bacteroidota bacterium]|jgi:hypothetical protein
MNQISLKNHFWILMLLIGLSSCQKEEYTFGSLTSPSGLTLNTTVVGVDAANPNGNGTGVVNINTAATSAITYKIDFGDGKVQMVPSGIISYKYTMPGINEYTITVTAVGTGGITTVVSKKIKVFVAFTIPSAILQNLTGGSSRVWICDKDADGHFGVGPADGFAPIWYAAPANSRSADGFYNDEITFAKTATSQITMNADHKGETFVIGAAVSYYGLTGPEGKYPIVTGGLKTLGFMDATSASTPANSTRIQFSVPGNGLVMIGLGSTTYEILSLTSTTMYLRTIGSDGLAWYQKLKVKP